MCAMVKLDGTSSSWMVHTMYIYILMYNICVRYKYIHITYYRYIIIDCTKNVRVDLLQTQKAPQKKMRESVKPGW